MWSGRAYSVAAKIRTKHQPDSACEACSGQVPTVDFHLCFGVYEGSRTQARPAGRAVRSCSDWVEDLAEMNQRSLPYGAAGSTPSFTSAGPGEDPFGDGHVRPFFRGALDSRRNWRKDGLESPLRIPELTLDVALEIFRTYRLPQALHRNPWRWC